MDQNKLELLRKISYLINKSCGICIYANIGSSDWGTCSFHKYSHLKHSEEVRDLSINRYGSCGNFKINQSELLKLEKFEEFMDKKVVE